MNKLTARPAEVDPLNDYLFYKIMGEKGNEVQLLGFINAVLGKREDDKFTSVEILENKSFTPDVIGDKSVVFDVRAVLHGKTKINVEVQLRNQQNMDKRSLFYWSREFSSSLREGQNYSDLPDVIAINIVNFDYLDTKDFHSCFHLRDSKERDIILTGALEIHFINMVRYRKHKRKAKDKLNDPLCRWLAWFDKNSPPDLLKEVVKMDTAILSADERLAYLSGDEDAMDLYRRRFLGLCDYNSNMNGAHEKGLEKGIAQGRAEGQQHILELLAQGLSVEEIKQRLLQS